MSKKIIQIYPEVVSSMSEWLVDDGEIVEEGDHIANVESMKVMYQIHAPAAGLLRQSVDLGEIVGQDTPIGSIEVSDHV